MGVAFSALQPACCFLIAGPSGAGVSSALESFADRGFLTLAQVSPASAFALIDAARSAHSRIALALSCGPDDRDALTALAEALPQRQAEAQARGDVLNLLRLDAPPETLTARYQHTGKRHPFESVHHGLLGAIQAQREALKAFKTLKPLMPTGYYAVDTSTHTRRELDQKIAKILGLPAEALPMTVYIQSFGFKRGLPPDAELVFDMRFIPNPYYDAALRPQSGLDAPVCDFIWAQPGVNAFWQSWSALIRDLLPRYQQEGKLRLSIAVGCTGGQHRSVCMAEALAQCLRDTFAGYTVIVTHRDQAHWAATPAPEPAITGGAGR